MAYDIRMAKLVTGEIAIGKFDTTASVINDPAVLQTVPTQQGVQIEPCSEGGHCIGFIEHGDWARYDKLDFGHKTAQVTFRAASATQGGIIELRLGSPAGELLGKCAIPDTGGWQSWATFKASIKPLSGTNDLCLLFVSAKDSAKRHPSDTRLWFASVGPSDTTIWAQLDALHFAYVAPGLPPPGAFRP